MELARSEPQARTSGRCPEPERMLITGGRDVEEEILIPDYVMRDVGFVEESFESYTSKQTPVK